MHQRDIDRIVKVLREKCLFTVHQVTEILHRCPYVLREDPDELEYKFQVRVTERLEDRQRTLECSRVSSVGKKHGIPSGQRTWFWFFHAHTGEMDSAAFLH